MTRHEDSPNRPPVIVMGGDFNALSVARSLAHAGVKVYALNYRHERVCYSRFCRRIRLEGSDSGPTTWEAFLLGPESDYLRGAVIFTCSDEAIEIIINNDEQLKSKFVLEEIETEVRRCLLDKLSTYQKAQEVGVDVPRYWQVKSLTELKMLESELAFPILLKPRFSHKFKKIWHRYKYFRAENITDACDYFAQTREQKVDVLIMEFVPGDDTKACSYYVYMDENNAPLVELTKRGLRRYPANMGRETFGFTDWNPEVRDLGVRFFQHVGLRGPANIEFN